MEFLTVQQIAERWGITPRRVQEMCRNGEIEGAVRHGRAYLVPATAKKTDKSIRFSVKPQATEGGAPETGADMASGRYYRGILDLYKVPGTAEETMAGINDEFTRDLFFAQLSFYRGEFEKTVAFADKYTDESEKYISYRCAVGMQYMQGAVGTGDIQQWRRGWEYIAGASCNTRQENDIREFWLAAGATTVSDNSHFPAWFRKGDFSHVPKRTFPAAGYYYIKHLYILGHYDDEDQRHTEPMEIMRLMPLLVEPFIAFAASDNIVIIEIQMRLMCALAYHISGKDGEAIPHLEKAIDLAVPDRLYEPLAEYRRRFGFLMDDVISDRCPKALPEVKRIAKLINDGWVILHNKVKGKNLASGLSTREWQVARLASYGLSNKDIADRMNVSVNAVKQALRLAMDKTGAESRADIANYI